jgi:hypothetical protein
MSSTQQGRSSGPVESAIGKRLDGSPGAICKTSGTAPTASVGQLGNVLGAAGRGAEADAALVALGLDMPVEEESL